MSFFDDNIEQNEELSVFRESDWEAMQKLLQEEEEKKRPFLFWWIGSSLILVICVVSFMAYKNQREQNLIWLTKENSQLKILLPDLKSLPAEQNIVQTDFEIKTTKPKKDYTSQNINYSDFKIARIEQNKNATNLEKIKPNFIEEKTNFYIKTTNFLDKKIDTIVTTTEKQENLIGLNTKNTDKLAVKTDSFFIRNESCIPTNQMKIKRLDYGIYTGINIEIIPNSTPQYLPEIGFSMNYKLSKHYFVGTRLTYLAKLLTNEKIEVDYTEKEISSFTEDLNQNASTNSIYTPSVYDTIQFQYYQNSLNHYLNLPLYFGYQKANHQFSVGVNNRLYIGEYQWKVKNEKTTARNFFTIANNISPVANYSFSLHGRYSYQLNKKWHVETQILREVYHKNQTAKNWQIGIGMTYLLSK